MPSRLNVRDQGPDFGGKVGVGAELKLAPEAGDCLRSTVSAKSHDARAEEQRAEGDSILRRPAAAIAQMARFAGHIVEHGSEPRVFGGAGAGTKTAENSSSPVSWSAALTPLRLGAG